MRERQIKNRMYILDATLLLGKVDNFIEEVNKSSSIFSDLDFRGKHLLIKELMTILICKLISDTNDQPIYPLVPSLSINEILNDRIITSLITDLHLSVFHLYGNMFRFSGNVEINIDVVLSGCNITIFTYENELE